MIVFFERRGISSTNFQPPKIASVMPISQEIIAAYGLRILIQKPAALMARIA